MKCNLCWLLIFVPALAFAKHSPSEVVSPSGIVGLWTSQNAQFPSCIFRQDGTAHFVGADSSKDSQRFCYRADFTTNPATLDILFGKGSSETTTAYTIIKLIDKDTLLMAPWADDARPTTFTDQVIKLLRRDTSKEDFVGTWSDGLALRKDGRGVCGGCALRWRKTDTGIRVVVGLSGESLDLKLAFNKDDGTLVGEHEGKRKVYLKINSDEPADYEGEVAGVHQREFELAMKNPPHVTTNTFAKAEDMFAAVKAFPATNHVDMTLRSEREHNSITVRNYNGVTFIEVCCRKGIRSPQKGDDDFWGDQAPPVHESVWSQSPPKVSLHETVYVSAEKLDAYMTWLKGKNIVSHLNYLVSKSRWRIEGYTLYCAVNIPNNPGVTVETLEFLTKQILAPFEGPYRLDIWRR